MTGELDSIIESVKENPEQKDKQAAVKAVRELGKTNELQTAMSADQNSEGVVDRLAQLEEALNVQTKVELAEGSGLNIEADKVSVIGAGLNTEGITAPTLTIDKVSKDLEIPSVYSNFLLQVDLSLNVGG